MSDPLSVAASVAGLLTLSGKIYTSLSGIIARTTDAPNFSELEQQLGKWPEDVHRSRWKRLRWAAVEEKLLALNDKIQQDKMSLTLVLNILQCESELEAQKSRDSLKLMMERILEENGDLRAEIAQIGSRKACSTLPSRDTHMARSEYSRAIGVALPVEPFPVSLQPTNRIQEASSPLLEANHNIDSNNDNDGTSTIRGSIKEQIPQAGDHNTIRNPERIKSSFHDPLTPPTSPINDSAEPLVHVAAPLFSFTHPFETILKNSRVYNRVDHKDTCDTSYTTNHSISKVWTMLSGLSLSQVSNISVLALPISASDILQSWFYRTYMSVKPVEGVYKIAILGDALVGKSALAVAFCADPYIGAADLKPDSTVEDRHSVCVMVDESRYRIDIIDTAPSFLDYDFLIGDAIQEADGFIIAYSTTDPQSFALIQQVHNRIIDVKGYQWQESSPGLVVIVGTKSDMPQLRGVTRDEAQGEAEDLKCRYFECSAKLGQGVAAPFMELVRSLSPNAEEPPSSPSTVARPSFRTRARSILSRRPVGIAITSRTSLSDFKTAVSGTFE